MDFLETDAQAPPCWDFMRGKCQHKNCKFTHPAGIFFSPHNRSDPFPPPEPVPVDIILAEEARKDGAYLETWSQRPDKIPPTIVPPAVFYKPIAWKTAPCRHFIRTGFCPMGNECNFIHDLQLLEAAQGGKSPAKLKPDAPQSGPTMSHCWAYVQGKCHNPSCKYLHPGSIEPYKKHTPCVAWPLCSYGQNCEFKHPEPLGTQRSLSSIPPPPASSQPPTQSSAPASTSSISPLSLPQPIYTAVPPLSPVQPIYYAPSSGGSYSSGPVPVSPINQPLYSSVEINGTTYYPPGPSPFSPIFASPTPPFLAPGPPNTFTPVSISPTTPITPFFNMNSNAPTAPAPAPYTHAVIHPHHPSLQIPQHAYPPVVPGPPPSIQHPSQTAESWHNPHPPLPRQIEPPNALGLRTTSAPFFASPNSRPMDHHYKPPPTARSPSSRRKYQARGVDPVKTVSKKQDITMHAHSKSTSIHHDEVYRADPRRRIGHTRRISVQVKNRGDFGGE
ncbi:hypothetical protein D9758_014115 [Tetrapyrgos nigripes]|uniref:C3H1-type domain-containing protein n=1 Tax=Tetrapyrgos nigripes TaxID=182062 RepID=A0A8H5FJ29_9AGAR|nr:hypothetical protein D9758_014115 [Tetrapyrgos nigripes]